MSLINNKINYLALSLLIGMSFRSSLVESHNYIDVDKIFNLVQEQIVAPASKELIVMWNFDTTKEDKLSLLQAFDNEISITSEFDNFMLITANNIETAETLYRELENSTALMSIEYNHEVDLNYTEDAYSVTQWGLENRGYYAHLVGKQLVNIYSTEDVDLEVPEAWSIYNKKEVKTREVIVAVIDTGVDNNHPDLVNSMWVNKAEKPGDGIDNDKNGYVDDIFGWDFYNDDNTVCHYEMDVKTEEIRASADDNDDHGTHCAGIIAATANNDIGIAGVASNIDVKIMALKIHGGPNGKGSIADAILAIKYATVMGADVVNLSWGSSTYSRTLEKAISQSPMLFVTAAGNTGGNNDVSPMYPANYALPNIISVTFINEFGALTTKSNYGKKTVDIAAPGMDILSTAVGNQYESLSGSSMATPHITGLAAILYSCSDKLSPKSVRDVITMNVKPLASLRGSIAVAGIPNAYLMVQSMPYLVIDSKAPTLSINTYFDQNKIKLGLAPKDYGNSGIRVIRYLSGKKGVKAFKHGTVGTEIAETSLSLSKSGTYTFYLSDYAGNETVKVYNVIDDTQAPLITASFQNSTNIISIEVDLKVIDELSGIKSVRYAKGKRTVSDFTSGKLGTIISLEDGIKKLRLMQEGYYTFYAVDYRGNKTVHVIDLTQKPITTLSLTQSFNTLNINETYKINYTYAPSNTTDKIYYFSSDPSVASVSQRGIIHGKSPGRTLVTIRTSSGLVRKLVITVI